MGGGAYLRPRDQLKLGLMTVEHALFMLSRLNVVSSLLRRLI